MAKQKFYSLHDSVVAGDGEVREITVVGRLTQGNKADTVKEKVPVELGPRRTVSGDLEFKVKKFNRKLEIGMAICNPEDEYSSEYGEKVAFGRIKDGDDIGRIETDSVMMLTDDMVDAILFTKMYYIKNHIDEYLPQE